MYNDQESSSPASSIGICEPLATLHPKKKKKNNHPHKNEESSLSDEEENVTTVTAEIHYLNYKHHLQLIIRP